jgi:hypothetical protein
MIHKLLGAANAAFNYGWQLFAPSVLNGGRRAHSACPQSPSSSPCGGILQYRWRTSCLRSEDGVRTTS